MHTITQRLMLGLAGAALAVAAVPATTFATTDLHVCTWHTEQVGDAVGTISAAPDAVLGPNNGGLPGGDKGPYPISFSTTDGAGVLASANSTCA